MKYATNEKSIKTIDFEDSIWDNTQERDIGVQEKINKEELKKRYSLGLFLIRKLFIK